MSWWQWLLVIVVMLVTYVAWSAFAGWLIARYARPAMRRCVQCAGSGVQAAGNRGGGWFTPCWWCGGRGVR